MRYAESINYIHLIVQAYVNQFTETNPAINIALGNEASKHLEIIIQALSNYDTSLTNQEGNNDE